MSLYDDLLPPRYVPPTPIRKSKAQGRSCQACGDRTMRGSNRCAACAAADYRMAGERLPVSCWCQNTSVWVRRTDIFRGLTRSCGLPDCRPEAA